MANLWKNLNRRQRGIVIGSAALILVSLIIVSSTVANRPDYVTLYNKLDPNDAGEIVQKLTEKKISYQISPDGSGILVPAKDVYAVRWSLAADGLPKGGGVGYEIFDKTNLGATDWERRINYIRALQGELERTFRQMEGVEQAKVLIALPEQSLFVREQKPTTASVVLKLKPGLELDNNQIRGIVLLITHSVEGLKPDQVTVVDVHGRLLTSGIDLNNDNQGLAGSSGRLETQRKFQKDLEHNLQTLLEQVLGPGNVVARVNAELNFDQRSTENTLFRSPSQNGQGLLTSLQELQETFRGTTGGGGVPGVQSNTPGQTPNTPEYQAANPTGNSQSDKSSRTATYAVDQVKENLVVAPGSVRRLSVSVVVNRNLSATEKGAIEKMVAATIGSDPKRDDQINVTGLPFNTQLADQARVALEADAKARATTTRNLYIALGAGLLLTLFAFRSLARRARGLSAGQMALGPGGAMAVHMSLPPPEPTIPLTPEEMERERVKKEIHKLANQKPEDVANLLKTWLSEEQ